MMMLRRIMIQILNPKVQIRKCQWVLVVRPIVFEEDVPKAEEEVRNNIEVFKGFDFKTIYSDDGREF